MTTRAKPPLEIELKYRVIEAAAGDRYLALDEVAGFSPASPVRSSQVEDRYVDTPDGAMARAGFATRLRQTAAGTTVAVKSSVRRIGETSVHRREELEGPADRTAHPRDWPASDARSLILELCGDAPLVELVTIRQLRRKRVLAAGRSKVELSLDEVDAVARSRVVDRFVELEVELIAGDESVLAAIDELLARDPGLAPADSSKLEAALRAVARTAPKRGRKTVPEPSVLARALALEALTVAGEADADGPDGAAEPAESNGHARPEAVDESTTAAGGRQDVAEPPPSAEAGPRPTAPAEASAEAPPVGRPASVPPATRRRAQPVPKATRPAAPRLVVGKTPGVLAEDHLAEAGRKVLRFHLARMIARESGAREGRDAEELHAMRVATRRQRAAWRIFGDAFRNGRTKAYRARLRDVASRLGAVRDLDVLLEAADAYRADLPAGEQRALEPLLSAWRSHRDDARVLLVRELDSDGYRRWLDDYAEFVRHEGTAVMPVGPTAPHRVRDTAASRIQAAYEQVRAYEPVLRWADVETLHDLRIAGKWLRYSLEFVRDALPDDAAGLIARVTALQDHLGMLNDADVAAHLARSFLVEHGGSLSQAESAAIGRYLVSREREVARLRRTVGRPWRGVVGLAFRRSLGRTLAAL
jgi:CHAD domain-containing protein